MLIPAQGRSRQEILETLKSYKQNDLDWESGKITSYVYYPGQSAMDLISKAYTMYLTESALDPTSTPSILRIENEIIGMISNLVGGDENTVGNFTSGGTESVMMAVLSARNRARALHPEIIAPEIVIPFTAHACFHKAAHYLGVNVVTVPVLDGSFRADVDAMRDAITDNTILVAGSAPGWAHGVVDPIREIGQIALDKELLFHVDACVGGIHLPYMRKLGMAVPEFDFSVPGVTSMSVDIHKYGYAAKNASVILYKNKALRRHQIFACSGWPGYTIVNPTAGSSRTCGSLAAAWAALNYFGDAGYMKIVEEVMAATRLLVDGINGTQGLEVLGSPDMCLFAFRCTTDKLNAYQIADELKARGGWHVQPQFARRNSPSNLQVGMTSMNAPLAAAMLKDLQDVVRDLLKKDTPSQAAGLAMAMKNIELKADEQTVDMLLQMAGVTADAVPDRIEEVNTILEALPVDLTEFILTSYINNILKPA
jgi:glutamate/tyrosine decarboxylase-like PLP-dependent enzyme